MRAERETAQKVAAEAQRNVQTANADLQALQASHAHQKQQLHSQLDTLQAESAALQVCNAFFRLEVAAGSGQVLAGQWEAIMASECSHGD